MQKDDEFINTIDDDNCEDIPSQEDVGSGRRSSTGTSSNTSRKSRKDNSKNGKDEDPIVEHFKNVSTTFGSFMQEIVPHFAAMANAMQHEKNIADKRDQVIDELMNLESLTPYEMLKAGEIITSDDKKTSYFFSLPAQLKHPYAVSLVYPHMASSSSNGYTNI
jgi:hypothetical protein